MAKRRILVVEDEQPIRELLRKLLEADYEVAVAANGEEGLARSRDFRPDGILLDLRLPKLDGLDLLRLLKQAPETATVPVIVLSGIGASDSLLDAQALGAVDYLIKPFDPADVQRTVQEYVLRS